jgi:cation-transporting ATPase I
LGGALNRAIVGRAATTAAGAGGAWLVARATGTASRASTVALVALVGSQLGQTLTSGGNSPQVVGATLGSAALLAAIVQTPGVSHVFGCRPLGPMGWATGLGAAGVATVASKIVPGALSAGVEQLVGDSRAG